jgi:hypothetical protein
MHHHPPWVSCSVLLFYVTIGGESERHGGFRKGSDDKGAGIVRKLNDVMECWEVEQEIVDRMLLVGRWGSLQ